MRIVAGRFRGAHLKAPAGEATRPTSDRVREAVFNILMHGSCGTRIEGARVLDLFAGTGALGLEALSRGAAFSLFVEENADARGLIRENIEALRLTGVTKIFRRDATDLGAINRIEPFDLVFLDPPYGFGLGEKALASAAAGNWLKEGAVIVLEERAGAVRSLPEGFQEIDRRAWGETEAVFARYQPEFRRSLTSLCLAPTPCCRNLRPDPPMKNSAALPALRPKVSFQDLILTLQQFWAAQGCVILQPYDMEVGAGTFHPATTLRALGPKTWNAAYVQPSRRPKDGRYGENPNRLQHYYQFQVIMKPSPPDILDLYLKSLDAIGIDTQLNDIRFVEDDWESPTLGAWGLGWEVWCNGMEVTQFTYFQQVGGFDCNPVSGEITYGLERLAMYVQGVDRVFDLNFNGRDDARKLSYGDVFLQAEQEYSRYNFEHANTDALLVHFKDAEAECRSLLEKGAPKGNDPRHMLALPAYDQCIKASHIFNLLDARGVISVTERQSYILRVRELAKACCGAWLKTEGGGAG